MKFSFLFLIALLVSGNCFAKKVDFSCLEGINVFSMSVGDDGNYTDDAMGTVTLSMKEKGKYLHLYAVTPHYLWPSGAAMLLSKNGDHYQSVTGEMKLIPLCQSNEMYLQFPKVDGGAIFGKIKI